jgi:hypothetical protein
MKIRPNPPKNLKRKVKDDEDELPSKIASKILQTIKKPLQIIAVPKPKVNPIAGKGQKN